VLIVCLVVIGLASGILLFTVVKPNPQDTPRGVVKEFVDDLKAGTYGDARTLLCKKLKTQLPGSDQVKAEVGFDPATITDFQIASTEDGTFEGDNATAVNVNVDRCGAAQADLRIVVTTEGGKKVVCAYGVQDG